MRITPFAAFLLFIVACTDPAEYDHIRSDRVIIIGFDGFGVEGFNSVRHPNIDSLFADGIISLTTRTVMPSVTMPNWTSHLCGSGPEQHGVTNNEWTLENHPLPPVETDDDGYPLSIFKLLKDAYPEAKTGYYYNWPNLIYPVNQAYLDEVSFEEDDGFRENYEKAFTFIQSNQDVPTLVFLYSVHADNIGHTYEWMSAEYTAALEAGDVAVGELVDKLKKEGLYESSTFLLITDHGGIGTGHGGVSPTEMEVPWAISGQGVSRQGILTHPNSNTNTAVVIARLFGINDLPESWNGQVPGGIFD